MMTCEELSNLKSGDRIYQLSTVYREIGEDSDCDEHITEINVRYNVHDGKTERLYLNCEDKNENWYTFPYGFKPTIDGNSYVCIINASYKNIYRTWGDAYEALNDIIEEWRSFDKEAVQSQIEKRNCSYWAITQSVQRNNR